MRPIALHVRAGSLSAARAEVACQALETAMDQLGVAPEAEIALVLTVDEELGALNHAYRGIHGPTDVLSFSADPADLPPGEAPYLGDVVISVAQAATSAADAERGLTEELCLLAVHGLLHLMGYEDETDEGAAAMRRIETELGVR